MLKVGLVISKLFEASQTIKFSSVWQMAALRQRKQVVESIDRSVKPDVQHFPEIRAIAATSSGKSLESQLVALQKAWSQLMLTYGLKEDLLQSYLHHQTSLVAKQLPQWKVIVVKEIDQLSWSKQKLLSDELVLFGEERGIVLDPFRDPDEYPELHQLVVDFGRTMCQQYPTVFRDLYLLHAHDIAELQYKANEELRKLLRDHPFANSVPPESMIRGTTLMKYFEEKKDVANWYLFTDREWSGLSDYCFGYLRSLPDEPFDPIAQTDFIDPVIQLTAWEHAGLLFGAGWRVLLKVQSGPRPSPIIYQLKPGDLQEPHPREVKLANENEPNLSLN